ncbi:hypothetical protein RFI_37391 [Reticulomyxa filosa]|uniref:Uncharacterized protein n=1 Tax=Reticulomyxa filosa TaxID=46433 RepID=X6LES6_RETFI|nr:hypothetical protein RFI_37391 [Reticulomyxa filosa]|eukprot:ETO00069.1 hypothetical protein RFI_37391 [Reticulomyxa filosa]
MQNWLEKLIDEDENKDKENGNEKENKKEEANIASNESNKKQEASTATTDNEKSKPRQISENERGHFYQIKNFFGSFGIAKKKGILSLD